MANFDGFMEVARNIMAGVTRTIDQSQDLDTLNSIEIRLEGLLRNTRRMVTRYPQCQPLYQDVREYLDIVQEMKSTQPGENFARPPKIYGRGRPTYDISEEQLELLVDLNFTNKAIGELLHVSIAVVKRRLQHFGISRRDRYSVLPDEALDDRVREITAGNPSLGQRVVQGMLKSEGINIQRWRVAESLIRIDEAAVAMRWSQVIKRRNYQVPGPNALWHIDGNHKLIRWGFVIHGGIDGFNRMVVFLNVSTNNRASTVFSAFLPATERFGVPSRVRCDHGGENMEVAAFMIMYRGENRGSCITGKSVHNQRIERLWRDLFQGCTSTYHALFSHLEHEGVLNPDDPVHIWCLQYVFLPRIKRDVIRFQDGWNEHRMRSVRGMSPKQLYVSGILQNVNRGQRGIDDLFFEPVSADAADVQVDDFGIDWDEPAPEDEDADRTMSSIESPLTADQHAQLQEQVQPLSDSADGFGIDLYLKAVSFCNAVAVTT